MSDDECPFQLRVQAYHDGELDGDPAALQSVEAHVKSCRVCAAELRGVRELSKRFDPIAVSTDWEPTADEVRRMHAAVEDEAVEERGAGSLFRFGGMLAGLAASVLIISAAWLAEWSPSSPSSVSSPGSSGQIVARAEDADWQRVASSAQADPRPKVTTQSDSPYATHLADKQVSGWMIFNLDPSER